MKVERGSFLVVNMPVQICQRFLGSISQPHLKISYKLP